MAPHRDPISLRTTRINNIILGKGAIYKSTLSASAAARRSTNGGVPTISPAVIETLNRECLLDVFCLLYNECDKDALKKRDRNIAEYVNKYRSIVEETQKMRVNSEDFTVKSLIGKGYFGDVHLVVEYQTGDVYAMKKIRKSVVTTSQVKEERDIMARRCSEWITNLQYAFQDNDYLYLVMEFLPGGDLLSLMSRHGPFDEELARFYLAELTLAINALHTLGYVHRDIKPENILFDRFGHIKLADFGNAAALDRDGHVFSLSPVGTPDYIAPELLQTISTYKLTKSLHDVSCDFWSMGIIGYELICETTPFHEENVHETYSKILSHCEDSHLKEIISFPSDLKLSDHFINLIKSLITNPKKRLNYEEICEHPYFDSIKWQTLRLQVPPIIPMVNGADDTSNFEDVARNKGRSSTFPKKSLSTNMKSHDFCGKDLPFIGYSYVHMEKDDFHSKMEDAIRIGKLNVKLKELQNKIKERDEEIQKLKQDLIRAEEMNKQSDSQTKMLQEAKDEINRMKNIVKEKTMELAACKTQMKTLQSSLKVEAEMWEKKEATITDLLRMNRQKYEEAKTSSEQRYEKLIVEKKNELASIVRKLDARESELTAKTEECAHLHEKMVNYKEMLQKFKEQAQLDKTQFEKNKMQLTDTYEQKLQELRAKLRNEKDSKSRLTLELRDVRTELDDSIISTKSSEEVKMRTARSNDEILKRLNREIEANHELHVRSAVLEKKIREMQCLSQELQQEVTRLERELQVAECSKNFAEIALATAESSPYDTAPGSLTELHAIEEQLRADLENAKENENVQKVRADKLQQIVEKLEEMMEKFNEQSPSPTKPHPAPRQLPSSVGDMLEKQNEKLEDKLAAVREQMIVERQSARTANLALWKVEKKLEETLTEKKMTQRRMELTEERIKKVQAERDESQRSNKMAQSEIKQREERIKELKDEISVLKNDVLKEHKMWENAEQERMKAKSEIIENISNINKLEERLVELRQKLQQSQQKCDALSMENKRLLRELNEERDKHSVAGDKASALQIQIKNLQDNYERLKYACTITDNQLTEIEGMLDAEQKLNKSQQKKIDKLHGIVREKDDAITQLKKELHEEQSQKKTTEARTQTMLKEINEYKENLKELQKKFILQQQELIEQTNVLYGTQERLELATNESNNLQKLNDNIEQEMTMLKEENARILSDLFHAREDTNRLQIELKDALANAAELHSEIDELQEILAEKENYYLQRDIKSEATLAQHKKLIDYLQLKVEDLSQKKKKTLADMLFGTNAGGKKENISPSAVESSILYRTLQEELRREKQHCKTLQEQLDKNPGSNVGTLRSPLKNIHKNDENKSEKDNNIKTTPTTNKSTLCKSQRNQNTGSDPTSPKNNATLHSDAEKTKQHHRFELALQEVNAGASNCIACDKTIIAGSPFWRCRECKSVAHRKCRSDVTTFCGSAVDAVERKIVAESESADVDGISLGKYSYEAKLDTVDGSTDDSTSNNITGEYNGNLVLSVEQQSPMLEINCAYEMELEKIILLGCNTGLYSYHVQAPAQHRLIHISGIDSVSYIAISEALAKAILVGSCGESLYQCDFRQLLSRSQANVSLNQSALEASVLDLPFANRSSNEKWQLVKISNETENALDSVAIAATSTRIVILKYDLKMQKFKPVRALDTATSVSSILYTRHTAIVSSDKFFEIDLDTYAAEEFVDLSDQSLSHTRTCQPVVAIRISRQEFLLCFMECGIFVDEYGCRSRPYDLNWEYTPTGFLYREPFLYISHFQSVQLIRLHRSYTNDIAGTSDASKDTDADIEDPEFKRAYLPFYMPTLLGESGKLNAYVLAIQKDTGLQQIYLIDSLHAFKKKYNESIDTISSIATSITLGSLATSDSI